MALLLAGCAPCELAPMPLAACLMPADDQPMPEGDPLILQLTGEVSTMGRGVPGGTCLEASPQLGEAPAGFDAPDARWLRMEDEATGRAWFLGVFAPDQRLWPTNGDLIELRFGVNQPEAPVPAVTLELRNRSGGLLLFLAQAGAVEGLGLPAGLEVAPGERVCATRDGCGRAGVWSLDLTLDGEALRLDPGRSEALGDFLAVHGGMELDRLGDPGACAEGGSHVRLGLLR